LYQNSLLRDNWEIYGTNTPPMTIQCSTQALHAG